MALFFCRARRSDGSMTIPVQTPISMPATTERDQNHVSRDGSNARLGSTRRGRLPLMVRILGGGDGLAFAESEVGDEPRAKCQMSTFEFCVTKLTSVGPLVWAAFLYRSFSHETFTRSLAHCALAPEYSPSPAHAPVDVRPAGTRAH